MNKVSVIIPCYNEFLFIKETLESVLKQTYKNIEIIVVDDCSEDKTVEIVKSYPVKLLEHEKNKGVCVARNWGAREAMGKYIIFLDGDDIILPTYIEDTLRVIEKEDVDFVYTRMKFFWKGSRKKAKYISCDFDVEELKRENYINISALIKKESFEKIGGFNVKVYPINKGYYADWELYINLAKNGYKGKLIKDYLLYVRKGEKRMTYEARKCKKYVVEKIHELHEEFFNDTDEKDNLSLKEGIYLLEMDDKFKYSDGDKKEKYLLESVSKAKDLNSNSVELEKYVVDWMSEYHLSRKRANLLEGFKFDFNSDVVEVGAGCGAITRFLGEKFNNVVAIEGSYNRAKVIRERTRDLDNVDIICAPYQEVKIKKKFKYVFCIGVLEYSSFFVKGSDPVKTALKSFSDLLDKDGVLVVAIENKFGFKYFAGHREDHNRRVYEGIEGYPSSSGKKQWAVTFGKKELTDKIVDVGFKDVEFYYPHPDYKIPDVIVSDRLARSNDAGLIGELMGRFKARSYSGNYSSKIDEKLAWEQIAKEGLIPNLANSFLVFAHKKEEGEISSCGEAWFYSLKRKPNFITKTKLYKEENGYLTKKERIYNELSECEREFCQIETNSDWYKGSSLSYLMYKAYKYAVIKKKIVDNSLIGLVKIWTDDIFEKSKNNQGMLDGKYIDYIPGNIIMENGKLMYFDNEWSYKGKISMKYLFIRGVVSFIRSNGIEVETISNRKHRSVKNWMFYIGRRLNILLNEKEFDKFIKKETIFQSKVTGVNRDEIKKEIEIVLNGNI